MRPWARIGTHTNPRMPVGGDGIAGGGRRAAGTPSRPSRVSVCPEAATCPISPSPYRQGRLTRAQALGQPAVAAKLERRASAATRCRLEISWPVTCVSAASAVRRTSSTSSDRLRATPRCAGSRDAGSAPRRGSTQGRPQRVFYPGRPREGPFPGGAAPPPVTRSRESARMAARMTPNHVKQKLRAGTPSSGVGSTSAAPLPRRPLPRSASTGSASTWSTARSTSRPWRDAGRGRTLPGGAARPGPRDHRRRDQRVLDAGAWGFVAPTSGSRRRSS